MRRKRKRAGNRRAGKVGNDAGKTAAAATPAAAPRLTTARSRWLFRLTAALGVPVLLLIALELGLRVLGYGYPVTFFVRNPVASRSGMVENQDFTRRFFGRELERSIQPLTVSHSKPAGTLRVFVFGGSAAEGDPAPAFGFARILEVMLQDRYPDRHVEVLNTAVTAINSHVVLPIAREATAYSGEVWVVYMGNNEVVGPFGSGTVFDAQTPPLPLIRASLRLRATRTGQLLAGLLSGMRTGTAPAEWGGMEMFLDQQVRRDDPRTERVYSNLERNLSDIIAAGVHSGVHLVVSTVGSNLRDCAPFASMHRPTLTPGQTSEWKQMYEAAIALEEAGRTNEAIAQFQKAEQIDDQFADLHFRLAQCQAALQHRDEALREFTLARDLDTLRFRTDSRQNDIIRRVTGEWESRGARLCDVEATMRRESAEGIPGRQWFYEHVHLTFAGNYLIAHQLAEAIVVSLSGGKAGLTDPASHPVPTLEECAERLGLTDYERLQMADEMRRRASQPPFTHQLNHAADAARREQVVADWRERDRTNFTASMAIYERALADRPDDWRIHDNYAGALLQHGRAAEAVKQWQREIELIPHRIETYDLMGSVLIEQKQLAEAERCYEEALRIQPDYFDGLIGLGRVRLAQHRGAEAIKLYRQALRVKPQSAQGYNHLGLALLQTENPGDAEKAFRTALSFEPGFKAGSLNLSAVLLDEGKADAAIANYEELLRTNPQDATVRVALGKAFVKTGRLQEALAQYAEVVKSSPNDFDGHYLLGSTLIRLNRLADAEPEMAAAVRIRPDSLQGRFNYGSILASLHKTDEARVQFEETLRINPDFAAAHLNLALVLSEQHRWSEAVVHLREVIRLEPQNSRARKLLQATQARQ